MANDVDLITLTAEVVAAYVANNPMAMDELGGLVRQVHQALGEAGAPPAAQPEPAPTPAVSIRKSITSEHLISLEDGRPYRTLKRHLGQLGLTPDQYRAKWGLPRDYPMVAPAYSARRSELAKQTGLGAARRKAPADAPAAESPPAAEPASKPGRGRPRKAAAEAAPPPAPAETPAQKPRGRPRKTPA